MKNFILPFPQTKLHEMFPEKEIRQVDLDGLKVGITRIGDEFFAFESTCPHRMTSLIPGDISEEKEVICPLHSYRFDLKTGAVKAGMCRELEIYPVEIVEEGLKISIPKVSN
ncbi:Rieske (2Fe-2S) protein [Algoriphagus zhangzhouensis]|uniref:3-phenylpropionate/trans-cinnamate dioxygenase ferredoxin subunit n=1 Tax=Algoriphagus zhangzhouensis TaxID=1073327 RepID=A0A1M7ZAQ1_9BACT|nr:Rieske 2Fe-2S domain-containing protein [Algoriphagus zhangzhouensis]TDY47043.1 3-phenylpropionate/trans-cinnamate dioxygenase ferredoxin subunit [Algoriphagus zhangzhouensis]SHO61998.1 3-phenylpropionate/trans-cinnamate dioxygenase ferredoxin subunit [Algoriphagus zhangzhouensis]